MSNDVSLHLRVKRIELSGVNTRSPEPIVIEFTLGQRAQRVEAAPVPRQRCGEELLFPLRGPGADHLVVKTTHGTQPIGTPVSIPLAPLSTSPRIVITVPLFRGSLTLSLSIQSSSAAAVRSLLGPSYDPTAELAPRVLDIHSAPLGSSPSDVTHALLIAAREREDRANDRALRAAIHASAHRPAMYGRWDYV